MSRFWKCQILATLAIHDAWDIPPIRGCGGNPFVSTNAKGHRPQAVEGGEPSDFRQPPDRFTG